MFCSRHFFPVPRTPPVCDAACRALLLLLNLFIHAAISAPLLSQAPPDESRLKAAFLFHFAQLVDWPPDSLGSGDQPVIFCTVAEDSVAGALESAVQGKQIGPHQIQVHRLRQKDDMHDCHLLFIGGQDSKRAAVTLASLKGAPVLTVGESEAFAQSGGVIGLLRQENKIRFEINLNAAQRANLKVSSRLLLLARTVIGEGQPR